MEFSTLPLTEIISKIDQSLIQFHYGEEYLKDHRKLWSIFLNYCNECNIKFYYEALIDDFLCYLKLQSNPNLSSQYYLKFADLALRYVRSYVNFGIIGTRRKLLSLEVPDGFKQCYTEFLEYINKKDYARETLKRFQMNIKYFAVFLYSREILSPAEIVPKAITQYALSLINITKRTLQTEMSLLKKFLFFLYLYGYSKEDCSQCIPKITATTSDYLPKIWTTDEIEKLLNVVDRANPTGKRDYALILLAIQLGMRSGDIANLKLTDIKWGKNCIEFVQSKTKKLNVLPLTSDIGNALIAYYKYGRPITENQNLFILNKPPYGKITRMSIIFEKYMISANIPIIRQAHRGLHALRHTLACRLLEAKIPTITISSILGHSDPSSVQHYLQLDIESLRKYALEVD